MVTAYQGQTGKPIRKRKGKRTKRSEDIGLHRVSFCPYNQFSHPNIIAYKDAFIDEKTSTLCIVMEFANGGDL